jgi:citrate synthase
LTEIFTRRTMTEFKPGLEGVVAFETEIAEPDREGGSLRYRGVDIESWSAGIASSRCGDSSWTRASSPACPRSSPMRAVA